MDTPTPWRDRQRIPIQPISGGPVKPTPRPSHPRPTAVGGYSGGMQGRIQAGRRRHWAFPRTAIVLSKPPAPSRHEWGTSASGPSHQRSSHMSADRLGERLGRGRSHVICDDRFAAPRTNHSSGRQIGATNPALDRITDSPMTVPDRQFRGMPHCPHDPMGPHQPYPFFARRRKPGDRPGWCGAVWLTVVVFDPANAQCIELVVL